MNLWNIFMASADSLLCGSCFLKLALMIFLQNSPNDLQLLSDAPAHHLFCLLPPVQPTQNSLPEVLAIIQVM